MMIGTPARIDPAPLSALLRHWLYQAAQQRMASNPLDPESSDAGACAAALVELDDDNPREGFSHRTAFVKGVEFAVDAIAAVLSDPLGDPIEPISVAAEDVRSTFRDMADDHRLTRERQARQTAEERADALAEALAVKQSGRASRAKAGVK
jgi:hypothetical protein